MDTGAPLPFDAVPVPTPPGGPLAVELVPAPDPWHVARKLSHLRHLLFLDSAEKHEARGRYSYVSADSRCTLTMHHSPKRERFAPDKADEVECGWVPLGSDPLGRAKLRLRSHPIATVAELPPFQGGLAGCFGYGYGHTLERIPFAQHDEFWVPDISVGIYDWVLSWDHLSERVWLVSTGFPFIDQPQQRDRATERLRDVLTLLRSEQGAYAPRSPQDQEADAPRSPSLAPQYPLLGFPNVTSNFSRAGYEDAVRRAVEYVHAGDCFQVNLSQRLLAPLREHPLELYGRLRELNPAPFAAYFDLGDFQVLSASPERFLRVYPGGEVETRPIKGTRPRGYTPEHDSALSSDLANSPKDRAENVMIVDLLRNDIGKVCEYGSVRVPRVCEVETFRYVHHLVSEVRGKLKPGLGPLDLLAAAFPGGSVTGAPKVRAMEIIAELEPTARGPYCGCLGWIGFDGAMDTNILIRTFTAGRGWVQFPVGGGIVADSDPAREYEETLHKAAGLLRALG